MTTNHPTHPTRVEPLSEAEREALACRCHESICPIHNEASDGYVEHEADALFAAVERILADRDRKARAEALEVAALLLGKVRDYWDGRPVQHHGHHIYADLLDVLTAIEADASHNRADQIGGE